MFFSRITCNDVVQLAAKSHDFEPKLSILSDFIDFFISLFGGTSKREHLSEIHHKIYDSASSQQDKLAAIIELKNNTIYPYCNDFHAEVIVDRDLLFSGKVKIISYFQDRLLQQVELKLDLKELSEHLHLTYVISGDSIANFSEFATGEFLTALNHLAKNTFDESTEQLSDRLSIWNDDVFLRFRLTFEVLRNAGRLPPSLQSDLYRKEFDTLDKRIQQLLDSQPHHFTDEIASILNVAKTKIDDLINTLYLGVADELDYLTTSFYAASMQQDSLKCDLLFACILKRVKELVPFYESPLFYNKSDVAWSQRIKENGAMSAAMDIVDAYYANQRLVKAPSMDLIPVSTQRSINDIVKLLEIYHSSHASSNCRISVESVDDYDKQYGQYQGYRVCLLEDKRILKAITIPDAALFLVHRHIVGDIFVEEDADVYKKGGHYKLYHIGEDVSKKSFLADTSRYFCIRDLHYH